MRAGFLAAELASYCCASAVVACINSASVTFAAGAGVAVAPTNRASRARGSNLFISGLLEIIRCVRGGREPAGAADARPFAVPHSALHRRGDRHVRLCGFGAGHGVTAAALSAKRSRTAAARRRRRHVAVRIGHADPAPDWPTAWAASRIALDTGSRAGAFLSRPPPH